MSTTFFFYESQQLCSHDALSRGAIPYTPAPARHFCSAFFGCDDSPTPAFFHTVHPIFQSHQSGPTRVGRKKLITAAKTHIRIAIPSDFSSPVLYSALIATSQPMPPITDARSPPMK